MSRIGKKPITLPQGVKAVLSGHVCAVEGKKGKLEMSFDERVKVNVSESEITCSVEENAPVEVRAQHGLVRSLIANMVHGVSEGYVKELQVVGVGFRAVVSGKNLELQLGFSHPVIYPIPDGIEVTVEKQTAIRIAGANRQLVGEVAAEIRDYRLPEPYKGKGVKYKDEVVRRKAGKAAAGAGAA